MLSIFKNRPTDVKGIRNALLQFIKEQLQKTEGGEGGIIRTLQLYITCNSEERHVYEAAVYAGEENRFKTDEVQKIADDYAINLPQDWNLEIIYATSAPDDAIKVPGIDAALQIITSTQKSAHKPFTAYIKVLNGISTKPVFDIHASLGKINIGREEQVQTADGFYRKNYIIFIGDTTEAANRSVSRQHAHIEWNEENGAFYLFADEGGIPPHNKVKIRNDAGEPWKLQSTEIGYRLQDGDQVILGESAVIEYNLRWK